MTNYVDVKYLNLLSGQLSQFKRKGDNLYNFRCPFCGDSQKDKLKARGYVFLVEGTYIFKCHNCGIGSSIENLIKYVNFELHKEYRLERFTDDNRASPVKQVGKTGISFSNRNYHLKTPLKDLKKISQLHYDHPAKRYVERRGIPKEFHRTLFYAPKFAKFVNSLIPSKLNEEYDEPRLIIPFFDEQNNLFGFQGRSFSKKGIRYITIMLDESKPKVFGLNLINKMKRVYITEGPIDSMFLPNALAMAGSDMPTQDIPDVVYVYDNEPRSVQIIKKMEKKIDAGFSVVVWPTFLKEKDINDMIGAKYSKTEILKIINDNTFKDLKAKVKLSEWRKV